MLPNSLQVSWRDEPVVLGETSDVGELVALARKTRTRRVDFDWVLTRTELQQLREAVHHWGSRARGRYQRFDAQILCAIKDVLGETTTPYLLSLASPAEAETFSSVSASPAGPDYRLSGWAMFDLIFNYSFIDDGPDGAPIRRLLGENLLAKLSDMASQLGWNVARFRAPSMAPVRHALYNLPLDHGTTNVPEGPITGSMTLELVGPYALIQQADRPCLFTDPVGHQRGIYLLTLPVDGVEHVHYVGQTTRSFSERISEHLAAYLSGRYSTLDIDSLSQGLQKYRYQPAANYGASLTGFVAQLDQLVPHLQGLLKTLRCHVIVPNQTKKGMLDRLEGALGRHFRDQKNAKWRQLFAIGAQFPNRIPGRERTTVRLQTQSVIAGMPGELVI